ncbi:MAG: hypothetical protein Q9160_003421 [Pyrenula sp. 1 TL-2023]
MRVKAALRTNNSWIDVTPAAKVEASALPETDERAWQRDVAHFLKEAPKNIRTYSSLETDVMHVPHEAQHGYYRFALTRADDRKVLCASPAVRLASTSMSGSSIRGASLSALPIELPIELSIKAGSIVANTMTSNAVSPVMDSRQGQVDRYMPGYAQTISTTAYNMSSVPDKIDVLNEGYDQVRGDFFDPAIITNAEAKSIVPPFPITLQSKVVPGTGRGTTELEFPTANLGISPSELPIRLMGTNFGWASVLSEKDNTSPEPVTPPSSPLPFAPTQPPPSRRVKSSKYT